MTELPVDVAGFRVSPTGDRLALALEVFPDCADLDCTKKRLDEAAVGEGGRVDASGERADLVERAVDLAAQLADQLRAAMVAAVDALGGELELDPQRHEALLGAVVQVALDPAALVVGAGLDARARLAHLVEQHRGFLAEPAVVEREHGVRPCGVDEPVLVRQRVVRVGRADPQREVVSHLGPQRGGLDAESVAGRRLPGGPVGRGHVGRRGIGGTAGRPGVGDGRVPRASDAGLVVKHHRQTKVVGRNRLQPVEFPPVEPRGDRLLVAV